MYVCNNTIVFLCFLFALFLYLSLRLISIRTSPFLETEEHSGCEAEGTQEREGLYFVCVCMQQ